MTKNSGKYVEKSRFLGGKLFKTLNLLLLLRQNVVFFRLV